MWGGHAFAWNFHSLPLSDNNSEGGRLLFLQKESGLYWSGLMGVNMQINVTTDYAIRIVLYLAIQNKVMNIFPECQLPPLNKIWILLCAQIAKSAIYHTSGRE